MSLTEQRIEVRNPDYQALREWLLEQGQRKTLVQLTFEEIEALLGYALPRAVYGQTAGWTNDRNHPLGETWLGAGWEVQAVDLPNELVTFRSIVNPSNEQTLPAEADSDDGYIYPYPWTKAVYKLTPARIEADLAKTFTLDELEAIKNFDPATLPVLPFSVAQLMVEERRGSPDGYGVPG